MRDELACCAVPGRRCAGRSRSLRPGRRRPRAVDSSGPREALSYENGGIAKVVAIAFFHVALQRSRTKLGDQRRNGRAGRSRATVAASGRVAEAPRHPLDIASGTARAPQPSSLVRSGGATLPLRPRSIRRAGADEIDADVRRRFGWIGEQSWKCPPSRLGSAILILASPPVGRLRHPCPRRTRGDPGDPEAGGSRRPRPCGTSSGRSPA